MKKKPVVVTGAFGFIGSNVVKRLVSIGEDVIAVYRDGGTNNWEYLKGLPIKDFIPSEKYVPSTTNKAVIHLGAFSSTTSTNFDSLIENNFRYTKYLADLCKNVGIRFVYASSASVYGNATNKTTEDFDLTPLNLYAQTKLWSDIALLDYDNVWGLRYFNVYGMNELHKGSQSSVIPKFLKEFKTTGKAKLFIEEDGREWGSASRDFVLVDDVARITCQIALHDCPVHHGNHIIDVGTGRSTSFYEIAQRVADAANIPLDIEWIPMPENIAKQYQYKTEANTRKLFEMDMTPIQGIEMGIPYYVEQLLRDKSLNVSG